MMNSDDDDITTLIQQHNESIVSASAWMKGISLSILASIIGGASKLAIRKSWLMIEQEVESQQQQQQQSSESTMTAEEITVDLVPMHNGDGDVSNVRYSQISNHTVETDDTCHPLHHTTFQDDTTGPTTMISNHHHFHRHKTFLPNLLRTCGMMGMTIFNPLCSVMAMNYASPSILAPFSGLTLVWIVLFSNTFVGEQPTLQQIFAAILIVIGEVIIAIFGDHTNDEGITIEEVVRSYHEPSFICFIIVIGIWMIYLLYFMCSSSAIRSTSPTFQRFAWGVAGGSITGFQNFLKDSLTILKASSSGTEFPYLLFIFMFGMAIITALSGLIILTLCMKRYDVTYSASMFVGSFCISASIMSAIHYNTFTHLNHVINFIGYPSGLLILLYGVYLLLMASSSSSSSSVTTSRNESTISHSEQTASSSSSRFVEASDRHTMIIDGELS